ARRATSAKTSGAANSPRFGALTEYRMAASCHPAPTKTRQRQAGYLAAGAGGPGSGPRMEMAHLLSRTPLPGGAAPNRTTRPAWNWSLPVARFTPKFQSMTVIAQPEMAEPGLARVSQQHLDWRVHQC